MMCIVLQSKHTLCTRRSPDGFREKITAPSRSIEASKQGALAVEKCLSLTFVVVLKRIVCLEQFSMRVGAIKNWCTGSVGRD